jgi:hypothetical protein
MGYANSRTNQPVARGPKRRAGEPGTPLMRKKGGNAMGMGISVDVLRKNLATLAPEEQSKALELLASVKIDLSKARGDLTGTEVSGFIFDGQVHPAESHKDAFIKLTQLAARKFLEKSSVLLTIQGRTKKYFSTTPRDFKHGYEKIKGTDYYADTNENAAQLNRRCQRILQAFGVDPTTFTIIPG